MFRSSIARLWSVRAWLRVRGCGLTLVAFATACAASPGERVTVVAIAPAVDASAPTVVTSPPDVRTAANDCVGADVGDATASEALPRGAGGFCVDAASTRTYGANAKLTMADVCTTLLDGECEIYVKLGVRRIVAARYVSTASASQAVYVTLSRFSDASSAEALFRMRTNANAATSPPGSILVPIVTTKSATYVVVGLHVAEIMFVSEEPPRVTEHEAQRGRAATLAIARAIDEKIRAR